jgi:hypothetical protein
MRTSTGSMRQRRYTSRQGSTISKAEDLSQLAAITGIGPVNSLAPLDGIAVVGVPGGIVGKLDS